MTATAPIQSHACDAATRRQTMVDCQIRTFDVTDQRVIARFLAVPRDAGLSTDHRDMAYSDIGFTTVAGRYLLPPLVLARLIQEARVRSRDRVLDVAAGVGYASAILAGLAAEVIALEATPELANALREGLGAMGVSGVLAEVGPLESGLPARAPYDVIIVAGAVEAGLEALFDQLAEGGRLLTILRTPNDPSGRAAKAISFEKRKGEIGRRYLFDASAPVLPAFRTAPGFVF